MGLMIKGREYKLSPRYAIDVLELAAVTKAIDSSDWSSGFAIAAKIVVDSLRATYRELPWYRRFRYLRFSRGGGLQFILRSLSERGLGEAVSSVLELEGVKKKGMRVSDPSDGTLPGESSRSSTASS